MLMLSLVRMNSLLLSIDDDGGEAIGTWIILVDGTMALVEAGPDGIIDEGSEFVSAGYLADDERYIYSTG